MPAEATITRTMKRRVVEFRSTRSPRDLLLTLPLNLDAPALAPVMPDENSDFPTR